MSRFIFGLLLLVSSSSFAFDHTHAQWDGWLKKYAKVDGPVTTVDYAAAKQKPDSLKSYTQSLEQVTRPEFDKWTDPQKMAFLINVYNSHTVALITEHYPVKSIKDLGGIFSSPWKKEFFRLFGEEHHLDYVEHDLLRKLWSEPRVHFAVNCASKGCPALRGEAFVATKLEAQLEDGAVKFLSDKSRNRYSEKDNKLFLSKIFDWYGGDFVKKAGSVQSFVAPRIAAGALQAKAAKADVAFLDYDWSLNDSGGRAGASK